MNENRTLTAVLLHGWPVTAGHWRYLIPVLEAAGITALVVEEEILPGIDIEIPMAGRDFYPAWHGPFNRASGLAEKLVPGREEAYYGAFLEQSAGPDGLNPDTLQSYLEAYNTPGVLDAGLAYYRTRSEDIHDINALATRPVRTPVLVIGGRYALGTAVAQGMNALATDVTPLVFDQSGHYPAEQEPDGVNRAIVQFLQQHA